MKAEQEIKELVKERYGSIAERTSQGCGCGSGCCGDGNEAVYSMMEESYTALPGYEAGADLALGCGLPTQYAQLEAGHTVVDLGSGAGNDAFVAAAEVGPEGRVIGIDMTPQMVEKARGLAKKKGLDNVEFLLGDIEALPLPDNSADRLISNCVLNLVPDKKKAFLEIKRVLKKGGMFSVSDIVLEGALPKEMKESVELYTGCVAGAIQKSEYLDLLASSGLRDVQVVKEREIPLPETLDSRNREKAGDRAPSYPRVLSITLNGWA